MNGEESSGALLASLILGAAAFAIFFLEILIPSAGLLAILCACAAIASIALGFIHDATLGMSLLALYALAAPFMIVFGLRMASRSPLGKRMVLSAEDPSRTGSGIATAGSALPSVGSRGEAITQLRPGGFVRIDGRRIDAVAESALIEAGTPIEVVGAPDGVLRVRPVRT